MSAIRLNTALEEGTFDVGGQTCCVFHPSREYDLHDLRTALRCDAQKGAQLSILHSFHPDYMFFKNAGFSVCQELSQENNVQASLFDLAVVPVVRAKRFAHALIHQAATCAQLVFVDGQKTDGIESIYKACKKQFPILGTISKRHGRAFWFLSSEAKPFAQVWAEQPVQKNKDGFFTRPGVFSEDHIDVGSQVLAAALPESLSGRLADFGAGWGYLSDAVLRRCERVQAIDLIEADQRALSCAQLNITDPRAQFFWADALLHKVEQSYDTIVMNPPFHTGRAALPELGQDFIRSAARALKSNGQLIMVANQSLPYEHVLNQHFKQVKLLTQERGFKVLHAQYLARK